MGVIEDVRKLLQDLVTPDLKAIGMRLGTVEQRLEKLEARVDRNHAEIMTTLDKRFDEVMGTISSLIRFNNLENRLTQLEAAKQKEQPQPSQ